MEKKRYKTQVLVAIVRGNFTFLPVLFYDPFINPFHSHYIIEK
jgi:hypothetical protein